MSQDSSSAGWDMLDSVRSDGGFRLTAVGVSPKRQRDVREEFIMIRTAIVFGLLMSLAPTFLCAGTGPKISFEKLEHDFGDVAYGESPSVEMTCANTGDDVLVLEKIESFCGCAKAIRGSQQLAPGSSTKIYAQIETLGMPPGRHSKTIAVNCNDPEHPSTRLKLMFNVVRHVSIDPDTLAVCLLECDKDAVFHLKASNHWTKPITLTSAKCSGSDEASLVPQEVVVLPGGKTDFQLAVRVKRRQDRSHAKGVALIETNDSHERTLPVRYFIQLPKKDGK
jgi:hypothetical protein